MHFDLVIIGTGSGNSIVGPEFDDWSIAIVEAGRFGGTCLNVGCIPTKMYVHPADLASGARRASALGVHATVESVDWPAMRDRIFGRIDVIEQSGRRYREGGRTPNTTVFAGTGRFTGPKAMTVTFPDGRDAELSGEHFVIAAGARPVIPDIPGLSDSSVRFHTSDTVMRIDALPRRLAIIGGGYIAAEFAHIFASFGTEVTQIVRGPVLLSHHDADISAAFTEAARARYDLRTDTQVTAVKPGPGHADAVILQIEGDQGRAEVEADMLLVATGRRPNGDLLDLGRTGVTLDGEGRVEVDEYQRTGVPGILALGDVSSHYALKHVANHEAKVVAHNLLHPDSPRAADHRFVPAAVFSEPQIATVGLTQEQADEDGVSYVVARQAYAGIAAGWAREDTEGFVKLLADPSTGRLLGAHIIGPEAATVIQPLIQAMSFGLPARQMAEGQYWIHPALPELLENALLQLPEPEGDSAG